MPRGTNRDENSRFLGTASRGLFWPASRDFARVPPERRSGLVFDLVAAGCPEFECEWTEAHRAKLAAHAVNLRIWLHWQIDRLATRDELACICGISVELLSRALQEDFAASKARILGAYGPKAVDQVRRVDVVDRPEKGGAL
ncbi:MAG TPA: hypothetical protein VFF65_07550 [Phycisphaerales bacterium]|nr:hypothetical protein [Phycisphaerales bacterium]